MNKNHPNHRWLTFTSRFKTKLLITFSLNLDSWSPQCGQLTSPFLFLPFSGLVPNSAFGLSSLHFFSQRQLLPALLALLLSEQPFQINLLFFSFSVLIRSLMLPFDVICVGNMV